MQELYSTRKRIEDGKLLERAACHVGVTVQGPPFPHQGLGGLAVDITGEVPAVLNTEAFGRYILAEEQDAWVKRYTADVIEGLDRLIAELQGHRQRLALELFQLQEGAEMVVLYRRCWRDWLSANLFFCLARTTPAAYLVDKTWRAYIDGGGIGERLAELRRKDLVQVRIDPVEDRGNPTVMVTFYVDIKSEQVATLPADVTAAILALRPGKEALDEQPAIG